MPNDIKLAKNFVPLLDEVYKKESVTSDLMGDPRMVKAGVNVDEVSYPQMEVTGLGDYSRSSGYTDGSVKLDWVTTKYNYDRGTKISVDTMDDQETFNLSFGMAGAELVRTKVAPEADAFTFAQIAGTDNITVATPVSITKAEDFLQALLDAKNKMDEDEVPTEGRFLYATSTLLNSVLALDSFKSKEVLSQYAVKAPVPQNRFYTAIDLLDGKSSGEELGHYKKADTGKDINFMIIHKPALIKHDKHIAHDLIAPANNPNSDAYILKYRKYGIVDVYKNKAAGIYLSHKA